MDHDNVLERGDLLRVVNDFLFQLVLDYNVFGQRAGRYAGEDAKAVKLGKLSLAHIDKYEKDLAASGVKSGLVTPILLPSYAPKDVKKRQLVRGKNVLPGSSVLQ